MTRPNVFILIKLHFYTQVSLLARIKEPWHSFEVQIAANLPLFGKKDRKTTKMVDVFVLNCWNL
jgi:hypothetical protein